MTIAILWLLVLGLAIACGRLSRRVAEAERAVGDLRRLRRETEEKQAELQRGLAVTRVHLADVVGGEPPDRDVIRRGAAVRDIQPAPAMALLARAPELFVLDVRTSQEFASGHIPNARLVPIDELEDRLGELPPGDTPILVTCAAGGRAAAACQILAAHGWTRLLNLSGGMHAWTGARVTEESPAPPPPAPVETAVSYRGGPVTDAQVIAAIRECYDPEIPLNVFDLGLIYGIDIAESAIAVKMTLTSEACPSARSIPLDVKSKIAALGQPNVTVDIVWDPPWHPTRISAEGKQKLGLA